MRDTFRSLWEKSPASGTVSEYLMGHTIDPLGYNKSYTDESFYRNEYIKASKFLNLLSRSDPYGLVEGSEVDKLQRDNDELRRQLENQNQDMRAELAELRRLVTEELKKTP